jgi:hypothetical protein
MIFLDRHAWSTGSLAVKESVFSVSAWIAAPLKTSRDGGVEKALHRVEYARLAVIDKTL